MGSTITAHGEFVHLLENSSSILATIADIPAEVVKVGHGIVKSIKYHANLDLLPYASGAAWNPQHTALSGTRTAVLSDIMRFIREPASALTAEILLLEGVLGCGKTAIANTVSKLCAEAEDITLLSSFFSDKGVPGRDTPALLLSTIAHDLSRIHPAPAEVISAAIEQSRSLLSPPLAQQFEHLLIRPAAFLPSVSSRFRHTLESTEASSSNAASASPSPTESRPLVVVIDALDAGSDEDFLRLLVEGIPHLPSCFRFVITTRPSLPVSAALKSPTASSHIIVRQLEIDKQCGEDVALYARHTLGKICEARRLGNEWPGEELEEAFVTRAREGGLFAWVASASEYLRARSVNPTKLLAKLASPSPALSSSPLNSLPCLEKLNAMYSEVFREAPWGDEDFETAYENVFGALMCLRRPMSAEVLDALLDASSVTGDGTSVSDALVPLAPLLRGLDGKGTSLQVVHPSLRDFVLQRGVGVNTQFSIDAQRVEERLALRTLAILNEQLPLIYPPPSPPLSPVSANTAVAPVPAAATIVKPGLLPSPPPSPPRLHPSYALLRARTRSDAASVKSTHSQASHISISRASITISDPTPFLPSPDSEEAEILSYASDMWLEHLMAVEEPPQELLDALATFVARDHANSNLMRWIGLCVHRHMSTSGDGDATEEEEEFQGAGAGECHQVQVGYYPVGKLEKLRMWCKRVEFDLWGHADRADVAAYLHALASHLHGRRQRQEQQQGQSQDPKLTTRTTGRITSLATASASSASLDAVREAVVLRRELAHDRPSTFNAELATSLQLLSYILATYPSPHSISTLNDNNSENNETSPDSEQEQEQRKKEALAAIHEAVTLRRNLASTWPALYNPVLAGSLHEFALRLGEMGGNAHAQDAEMAIQEERMLAGSSASASAVATPSIGL